MLIDVSILSTNEFLPHEVIDEVIPDKYIYHTDGEMLFTATVFESQEMVNQLIQFLFQGSEPIEEIYSEGNAYVLDLSKLREGLIDFNYLENNYSNWLEKTGRATSMSEYGMLMDFIGHARKGFHTKYLLMVVSVRQQP